MKKIVFGCAVLAAITGCALFLPAGLKTAIGERFTGTTTGDVEDSNSIIVLGKRTPESTRVTIVLKAGNVYEKYYLCGSLKKISGKEYYSYDTNWSSGYVFAISYTSNTNAQGYLKWVIYLETNNSVNYELQPRGLLKAQSVASWYSDLENFPIRINNHSQDWLITNNAPVRSTQVINLNLVFKMGNLPLTNTIGVTAGITNYIRWNFNNMDAFMNYIGDFSIAGNPSPPFNNWATNIFITNTSPYQNTTGVPFPTIVLPSNTILFLDLDILGTNQNTGGNVDWRTSKVGFKCSIPNKKILNLTAIGSDKPGKSAKILCDLEGDFIKTSITNFPNEH